MRKNIAIGALAAAIILVLAIAVIAINPTGQATLADQPAVKFGYRQNVAYLPFFVALGKGYFKQGGVEVEAVLFESSNQTIDALVAGRIDVAISNIPVVLALESKSPGMIKFFTMDELDRENFYDYILVKKDSGIRSWQDLKGKKAGIWLGSTAKLLYTKIFKAESLDGKVEIVEMKPELLIQALESGSVDAVFLLEPDATIALENGIGRVLDESLFAKYVMNPMPAAGAFFSTEFSEKNPEQTMKIAEAIKKAIDFINERPEEAKKIISKYTPISEEIAIKINTEKYSELTSAGIERVQELADLLYNEGFLDSAVDTSNMFFGTPRG